MTQKIYHMFRKENCADWYDGLPDHEDGNGPYETRIMFAEPQREQIPEKVTPEPNAEEKLRKLRRYLDDTLFDGNANERTVARTALAIIVLCIAAKVWSDL